MNGRKGLKEYNLFLIFFCLSFLFLPIHILIGYEGNIDKTEESWISGPSPIFRDKLLEWLKNNAYNKKGRNLFRLPVVVEFKDRYHLEIKRCYIGGKNGEGNQNVVLLEIDDTRMGIDFISLVRDFCLEENNSCAIWIEGLWGSLMNSEIDNIGKSVEGYETYTFTVLKVIGPVKENNPIPFVKRRVNEESKSTTSNLGDVIITSYGVGKIKVGKKFDLKLVPGDFYKHYFCDYIADVQPVEGVSLFEGKILVFFKSGPFQSEASKRYIKPDPKRFGYLAFKTAKRGVIVSRIAIFGPIAKTEKGITVGSTLEMLRSAYPDISYWSTPDDYSDDVISVAYTKSLQNVYFFFKELKKDLEAESKIVRIVITKE